MPPAYFLSALLSTVSYFEVTNLESLSLTSCVFERYSPAGGVDVCAFTLLN